MNLKLIESFFDEFKKPKYLLSPDEKMKTFAVWENPDKTEIEKAINESNPETQAARFIAIPDKAKVYVFNGDILHTYVKNKLHLNRGIMMFGIIKKEGNKYKGHYNDIKGLDAEEDEPFYEIILKENWQWLDKYFDITSIYETLMWRYKNERK